MTDWITNLFSGFAGVLVGGFLSYFLNTRLEKKEQKQVCAVLNDILKQTKTILNGSLGDGGIRSPYGYIKNVPAEAETIMPFLDNIITEIGVLPPSKNKTLIIQLYTEIKLFLSCAQNYKIRLENLRKFRKEFISKGFTELQYEHNTDYFDIDSYLFIDDNKHSSVIGEDFYKAQEILIDDLNNLSRTLLNLYKQLISKINTILKQSWED